ATGGQIDNIDVGAVNIDMGAGAVLHWPEWLQFSARDIARGTGEVRIGHEMVTMHAGAVVSRSPTSTTQAQDWVGIFATSGDIGDVTLGGVTYSLETGAVCSGHLTASI